MSIAGLLLLWAMGQSGTRVTVQSQVPETPVLQIGVRLIHDDTSRPSSGLNAFAVERNGVDDVPGYVYGSPNLCGVGESSTEPPGNLAPTVLGWNSRTQWPGWGWIISGHVLTRNGASATAIVGWRRLWERGTRVVNPEYHTQTVALGPGDLIDLDEVTPTVAGPCHATGARLAVKFAPLPRYSRGPAVSVGRTGAVSGSGGPGFGAGSSPGGGVGNDAAGSIRPGGTTRDIAESATAALDLASQMGAGLNGGALLDAAGRQTGARAPQLHPLPDAFYDADLWLVQSSPGGVADTKHVSLRVGPDGGSVAFPSTTVVTSHGLATVDVASMLRVLAAPDGSPMLRAAITRRIGYGRVDLGGTLQVMPLPSARDILSFEMPAQTPGGPDLLDGRQFSLRVRIAPGK